MCVLCLVPGATAIVSASGSTERKLLRGGGRVCVCPIHRLRQHRHHRRVPGAICPRCVCVCVYVPVRWRQAFLLVFLPAVSLCLITFLCVHRLCTFFPRRLSLCILNLFVCVWVCCARDSFHLWFCVRALCVVVVLSLHAVPLFGVCVCCVVCLHKRDRTC